MFILASNLSGASIICGNKGKVEKVDFVLFDQKAFTVEGFICQKPIKQFFNGSRGLLFKDTISIEHNTVYIDHEKKIELITKSHLLSKYLKENPIIGKHVKLSGQKKSLGTVKDVLFDSESGAILKFYIDSWIESFIIPIEKVKKIHNEYVEIEEIDNFVALKEASI